MTSKIHWSKEKEEGLQCLTYTVTDPVTGNRAKLWYDTSLKLWTSYAIDGEGYQLGSADYSNDKAAGKRSAELQLKKDNYHRNFKCLFVN